MLLNAVLLLDNCTVWASGAKMTLVKAKLAAVVVSARLQARTCIPTLANWDPVEQRDGRLARGGVLNWRARRSPNAAVFQRLFKRSKTAGSGVKIAVSNGPAAVTVNELAALELDTRAEVIVETQNSFDTVVYTA